MENSRTELSPNAVPNAVPNAATDNSQRLAAFLDRFEQIAVVILFSWMVVRVFDSSNPFAPLLVASESLVLIFVLLRRPSTDISLRFSDWLLAFGATTLPLMIDPSNDGQSSLAVLGVLLFVLGMVWQLWAKLVLRRSFGIAPANRGVKIGGPYQAMRHPIYFGYLLTHIAIAMLMPSLWNLAIYAAAWTIQIMRLLREEKLLLNDPSYRDYAAKVRCRLVPGLF